MKDDPVKYCNLYKDQGCSHVDGFLCDFNSCSMKKEYDNKYLALKMLVEDHNKSCISECKGRAKYCVDYLAIGRCCGDCPKHYIIKE